jgi:hypothetical protein
MMNRKDRRLTPRVASLFPLRYRLLPVEDSGYFEGRIQDLSAAGVRFRSSDEVRVRSGMLFELMIPGAQPVRSFGRTAWVRELANDGGFEVGGWFEDLSTSSRKAIERHIRGESVPAAPIRPARGSGLDAGVTRSATP